MKQVLELLNCDVTTGRDLHLIPISSGSIGKAMKGIVLAFGLLLLFVSKALSQGTVTFNNSNDSPARIFSWSLGDGGPFPTGTTVVLGLFYGPMGTTDPDSMVQLGQTTTIFPSPGRYNGGTRTTPDPPGTSAVFQVRAWDGAFGATWDEFMSNPAALAHGAGVGVTTLFISSTGGGGIPPAPPVALAATVPTLYIQVPEPSTICLLALGVFALTLRTKHR